MLGFSVAEQNACNLQSVPIENMILCSPCESFSEGQSITRSKMILMLEIDNNSEIVSSKYIHSPHSQSRLINEGRIVTIAGMLESILRSIILIRILCRGLAKG